MQHVTTQLRQSKKLFYQLLPVSFLMLSAIPVSAAEIQWAKYNFPPVYIPDGPYTNQGINDEIIALLQDRLKDYQHVTEMMNIPRIQRHMQQKKPLCTMFLKTSAREQQAYFSIPALPAQPHRIHYLTSNDRLKEFLSQHKRNGSISLQTLLQEGSEFTLGVTEKRSYSKERDALINKYKDRIHHRVGGSEANGLLQMLLRGRVDYIIEYPWAIRYEALLTDAPEISSIKIDETLPQLYAHIACTRTPEGKIIVDEINQHLLSLRSSHEYRAAAERWLSTDTLQDYRQEYRQMLDTKNL